MDQIVHCARCYKAISWEWCSDWYRHIHVKYCDDCKKIVEREQAVIRMRKYRERQREARKVKDARLAQLEMENQILREKFNKLWEDQENGNCGGVE